jgi:hypothetical protein
LPLLPQRLEHEEGVGKHDQGHVTVQAIPQTSLIVSEAAFALGILIELLDREAAGVPVPPGETKACLQAKH